jgi:hypothetical protein
MGWIDLDEFYKSYELNRKIEIEKKEEQKKIEKGSGKPFRPSRGSSPQPRKANRIGTLLSSSPRWHAGPTHQGHITIFFPGPKSMPETKSPHLYFPPLNSLYFPALIDV